ncbi:MAG: hypothetical protein LBR36_05915 [Bacteroidales bacterium]|jgi:hypothetical protein|nr:hypothetical protein [Bacteroidales bacterium]
MELTELKDKIISSFIGNKKELLEILALVENDNAVFPFNEYEFLICNLIEKKGLTFQTYLKIREEYLRKNPNLYYFELVGKGFGGIMESYIHGKCPELQISDDNKYDFKLNDIKIEIKAGRAVENNRPQNEPLVQKALARNTTKNFDIIIEQIKPDFCDVFVWVVVYRDDMDIWILSSKEVKNLKGYSDKQHAKSKGVGQFHIKPNNIKTLDKYKFKGKNLKRAIQNAAKRT